MDLTQDVGILFRAPMIRAILSGRKTHTRRIMKPQPSSTHFGVGYFSPRKTYRTGEEIPGEEVYGAFAEDWHVRCPYGAPGTKLWVRENFWERPNVTLGEMREGADTWPAYAYAADDHDFAELKRFGYRQRPSIHMPKSLCRIWLTITSIRCERLQDISEEDAKAEGVEPGCLTCGENCIDFGGCGYCRPAYRDSFAGLWQEINGRESWDANPWVWVIQFQREINNGS